MKRPLSTALIGIIFLSSSSAFLNLTSTLQPASAQGLNGLGAETIKPREKKRIAILDFDFSSINNLGFTSGIGGEGAGKGVSNILTNQMVKDGSFIVIERSKLDAVLAEQNLGTSGRIEPTTAAQIGRILGVDAVIVGTVTKFDVEEKAKGGFFGGFGGGDNKQIATVQITARMVSTATAEILSIAEGNGQSSHNNSSISAFGFGTTSSSDSQGRLLGEAAEQAIAQINTQFTAAGPKLAAAPAVVPVIDAVIADISGGQVVINKGGKDGFRPGMVLSVERVIKKITDPSTGKVLRVQTQSIGRFQLTEVDAQSAVGKLLAGNKGAIKVGDRARAVQ